MNLEKLERLRSESPRRPMITHTSDSHQIPSQGNAKSKLPIKKNAKNSNFEILCIRNFPYMQWIQLEL